MPQMRAFHDKCTIKLSYNSLVAIWSYRNNLHRYAALSLDECYIVLELLWELVVVANIADVAIPTWELAIDWLDQQDAAVRHIEHALHFSTKVGVTRGVNDVNLRALVTAFPLHLTGISAIRRISRER